MKPTKEIISQIMSTNYPHDKIESYELIQKNDIWNELKYKLKLLPYFSFFDIDNDFKIKHTQGRPYCVNDILFKEWMENQIFIIDRKRKIKKIRENGRNRS
jgi:hypothetical protein